MRTNRGDVGDLPVAIGSVIVSVAQPEPEGHPLESVVLVLVLHIDGTRTRPLCFEDEY